MPPDGQLTCARWPKLWRSTFRALSSDSAVVRHHGGGFCFVLLLGPVDYISRMVLFSATLQGSAGGQVLSHLAVTSCYRLCVMTLLLEVGLCSLRRRAVVAAQGGPLPPLITHWPRYCRAAGSLPSVASYRAALQVSCRPWQACTLFETAGLLSHLSTQGCCACLCTST